MRTVPLDGAGWSMCEALGETWRWYVDAPLPEAGNNVADAAAPAITAPGWLPAEVPGSVLADLRRLGEIPDPYTGRNSRFAEWTGARSWVYRRTVQLPQLATGECAVLEFDGLDPSGALYWDGSELARVDGMYEQLRARIPARAATAGRHRVAVVVDPVPDSQPQVGRTELVRVHRPRMNEGWDFCPRLPHQGIWRPARLVIATAHPAGVAVHSSLDGDGTGHIRVTARIDPGDPVAHRVVARVPSGEPVAECRGTGDIDVALTVPVPLLWQPRGLGEQPVYRVEVELDGEVVCRRSTGFRSAELVRNAGAPPGALPYTALVNGATLPLIGWNWVPADAQYGAVDPAKVRHLVDLAARSGARLLRVWGGGLVETEEFYDACDRAGLLVWQEFSQSSSGMQSAPATDADFVARMEHEAAVLVPARAHHPSLLLWAGGNELADDGAALDEERSPVLAALRDCVRRLDPGRAWLPTSPSGPAGHDTHGPWEHQGLRAHHVHYNERDSLAHTEFGVEGMTNRRALEAIVPAADRWPADRGNPVYRHLGEWWNNATLVQQSFRGRLTDLDTLRRASQLLQATGLGYAMEADRRRFPRCSMVLPWQLNESYPNAWCTSRIDYFGRPKPAYSAVARAFAAERVAVRVPTSVWDGCDELRAEAWVWSESGVDAQSRVRATLRAVTGEVLAEACWVIDSRVCDPCAAGTLTADAARVRHDAVVVWDFAWESPAGDELDRELVLACTGPDFAPLLDLEPATLDLSVDRRRDGWSVDVAHRGGPLVVGLQLVDDRPATDPGWLTIDGDPRPLLPGEQRSFAVSPAPSGPLLLESWNARSEEISA